NEQGQNAGLVQHIIWSWGSQLHLPLGQVIAWEHGVAVVLLAGTALTVMVARARKRISLPACVLLLFGLVLAVSSHVFPWYVTALLPWIVLLLPSSYGPGLRSVFLARVLVLTALWLFTVISLLGYIADWPTYYHLADDGLAGALSGAGLLALFPYWFPLLRKGFVYVRLKRHHSSSSVPR
ncbi:MAG TPA: hypothetical protein VHD63_21100, partial [Ktedonobacteraceae bacterium]|nr:hypothetical protein [Ktedonobacteraceae bacterium]